MVDHLFDCFRKRCQRRPNKKPGRSKRIRPRLEILEDRLVPAVFNVNSTADFIGFSPPGVVTLRSAIQAANTNADATNTINLTVPGAYRITLAGTPGETDNAAGEFAIFSTNLTTGSAKTNLNIVNTSGGTVIVDGNHLARVFDVNSSLQVGSVNITAGGAGFTGASGITFSAPTLAGGIQATGNLIVSAGMVVGVVITNPGTGYTTSAPPTLTFTGPGAGAAGNIVLTSPKINVSLSGFTIQNGLAQPGDLAAGSGGGIRSLGNPTLTLTNMVVTGNSASADGAGVVMENSSGGTDFLGGSTRGTLTIDNSTISNNHAGDAGGGVDVDGGGTVNINAGTVISGNTDVNQGAGVYLDGIANAVTGANMTAGGSGYTQAPIVNFGGPGTGAAGFATIAGGMVTAVTITNSGTGYTSAPTVTFVGGGGSGATATATMVANQTANLNMSGTLVISNTSTGTVNGLGGGISNAGNGAVMITASTIENNFAATTGGGFSDENNGLGTLNISNSFFLNNSAVGNGGGIFMSGPNATITNTQFEGNTTNANGGALFDSGATLTIMSATLTANTATGNGGGIEVETTGAGATASIIANTTITGNQALNNAGAENGGGIDAPATVFTGALTLQNDTINGNFADNGGGVFWGGTTGAFNVRNTIIAKNTATAAGPDANNPAGMFTDQGGNLIGSRSGNTGLVTVSPLDPKLGALQANGGPTVGAVDSSFILQTEALLPGSPAINGGVIAGAPATDERGLDRSVNGIIDAGADEIQQRDIVGRVSQTGQWWLGVSNGSAFANSPSLTWSTGVTWVDVQTGDFNGDGLADFVGRAKETGEWWVSLSNGSGGFTTSLWDTWSTGVTWVDVKVGDFVGDGKTDIVGRALETGEWWVAAATGSAFTTHLWGTWSTAVSWVDVRVGDFSGDGLADIAGRVSQDGSWWTGVSTGSSFSTSMWGSWSTAATWVDVSVGDFTGDGKADIAGRYSQTGQWWVAKSTGTSFTNSLWATWAADGPSVTWVDVKVGDFNGDGMADITGRWLQAGQWYTALSTGTSFTTTLWAMWSPAATWVDVQVGDFNGDGKTDIAGRWKEAGQWFTGISTGTFFTTTQWGAWSTAVNWVDVHNGDYV